MLVRLAWFLWVVLLVPSLLFGQETITVESPDEQVRKSQPSKDLQIQETEGERAETKQFEAKEEALKSLFEQKGYTVIPLPAFTYNRNERYWIGGLMSILKSNPKGEVTDIFAPQYLHNPSIGETVSLNYFGYPSDTEQYSAVVSYSDRKSTRLNSSHQKISYAVFC